MGVAPSATYYPAPMPDVAEPVDQYNQAIGDRLRAIRKQKGVSLQDVEEQSGQEFKASVLGAYERGERSLSLPRLQRLATFYGIPVDHLLPPGDRSGVAPSATPGSDGITIDLTRLQHAGPPAELIERFVKTIQLMRQDFNGRVLSIRRGDLRLIAGLLDESEEQVTEMLTGLTVDA
jgi:transcriptional regulator with XRE-family HTH domain